MSANGPVAGAATSAEDELVAAALLGVGRRPYDATHLASVAGLGLARPEARILAAAAVLGAGRRVGRRADRFEGAIDEAPPEDLAAAPEAAVQLLELLVGGQVPLSGVMGGGGEGDLVGHWLTACAAAGRRLPPPLLLPILDAATRRTVLRPPTLRALGRRGAWLAAMNPTWAWAATDADADTDGQHGDDVEARWATAPRPVRLALLASLRAQAPDQARTLLATTWPRETAADRAALVEALRTGLSDDDEPFLEAALDDRAAAVRTAAAGLLDSLPRSRRGARMAVRLAPLVHLDRRRLRDDHLDVDLPGGPDAAARRDGLAAGAKGVVRLEQLVGATPLTWWEQEFDQSPAEALRLAGASTVANALNRGFLAALRAQHDPRWAAAHVAEHGNPMALAVLDAPTAARLALPLLQARATPGPGGLGSGVGVNRAALQHLLGAVAGPWNDLFATAVIDVLRRIAGVDPTVVVPLGPVLAARLPPSTAAHVEGWAAAITTLGPAGDTVRSIHHTLTLRRAIDEAFHDQP